MTFEATADVLTTVFQYSQQVVRILEHFKLRSRDPEVAYCLDNAIAIELKLQSSVNDYTRHMSDKVEHAHFKWHDRQLLFSCLNGITDQRILTKEQAVSLVSTCHDALCRYYEGLTASTNSAEVLDFLKSLRDTREQQTRDCVWKTLRGFA